MKLICELTEDVGGLVVESVNGQKHYYIEGIFMQANVKNRNGRIYPLNVMEKEVDRYINECVSKNRATGELGHPEGPATDPKRVSHLITEMKQQGNDFYGKARILNTPNGDIIRGLIEGGVNFGVSSRGLGAVKQNSAGINEVAQFRLVTAADVVLDPSAPDAFVQGIMEGAEWVYDASGDCYRMAAEIEDIKKALDPKSVRIDESAKLAAFELFMKRISQITK